MQLIALLLLDRITNSSATKIKEILWIISGQHLGSLGATVTCGKGEWLWGRFASWCRHLQLLSIHVKKVSSWIIKSREDSCKSQSYLLCNRDQRLRITKNHR